MIWSWYQTITPATHTGEASNSNKGYIQNRRMIVFRHNGEIIEYDWCNRRRRTFRRLAVVDEPWPRLIQGFDSVYALAQEAIRHGGRLTFLIEELLTKDTVEYDAIHRGGAKWKFLPRSITHKNQGDVWSRARV